MRPDEQGGDSVRTAAAELVSEPDDIWVIGYNDSLGYTTFKGWDATYGIARQTAVTAHTALAGLEPAGHTDACTWSGTPYSNGCAWITGYRAVPPRYTQVFLMQVRNLGGTSGVAYGNFTNVASGLHPSGDAGKWCTHWSPPPFVYCDAWAERLLVVYLTGDRTAIKAKRLTTAGALIGTELTVATGTSMEHPQVAWLQTGDTGLWVVSYDTGEECQPGVPMNRIHTVVVNWNGTVGQNNSLGWCGGGDTCGGGVLALSAQSEGDGTLIASSFCYSTSLAARAPFASQPDRLAFNEYLNTLYILDSNGARIANPYHGGQLAKLLSGTYAADYSFREAWGLTGASDGVRLCTDTWACSADSDYTTLDHVGTAALRAGFHTAAMLFFTLAAPNDLYLTVLVNY